MTLKSKVKVTYLKEIKLLVMNFHADRPVPMYVITVNSLSGIPKSHICLKNLFLLLASVYYLITVFTTTTTTTLTTAPAATSSTTTNKQNYKHRKELSFF